MKIWLTKMSKQMGKANKRKSQEINTDSSNESAGKCIAVRTRSRANVAMVANYSKSPREKGIKTNERVKGKKSPVARKRIQFGGEKSPFAGVNNNASPLNVKKSAKGGTQPPPKKGVACTSNDQTQAVSDPSVVKPNEVVGDGFDVELYPNEN